MSVLTLGILMIAAGSISANSVDCATDSYCDNDCVVVIDEPQEGEWYDPVTIRWHYAGECRPVEYSLYYQEGTCDGDNWRNIEHDLGAIINEYEWDVSDLENGDYCIAVNMDQLSGPDAGSTTGVFHLDTKKPEVFLEFGTPSELVDYETYINQQTPITITCEDDGSGVDEIFYNIYTEGEEGWNLIHELSYDGDEVTFTSHEDSHHKIEYWCVDNVGKVSDVEEDEFFVDSVAPEFTKIVNGPQEGQCPPEKEGDVCYISTKTEIDVSVNDPEPHPVEGESCYYWYYVGDQRFPTEGVYRTLPIVFNEQSQHDLYLVCKDALGNEVRDLETFYVDTSAPGTEISFDGPQYENEEALWIDGVTEVVLTGSDVQPHPSGYDETFYRYKVVDDSYCWKDDNPRDIISVMTTEDDEEPWTLYEEPFSMEESCHMIEYYSVDKVGNQEDIKTAYVFVDKTKPTPIKEVGSPSVDCSKYPQQCEENWDWKISMGTTITLSCEDEGDHPSGMAGTQTSGIWYRVILDGDFETPHTDWTFANSDELVIQFSEESEHLVEFYCVDNVEKISETDSEIFKVEGEQFEITILKKWNLISIPFNLLNNNIWNVLEQAEGKIDIVWSYDEDGWHVYNPNSLNTSDLGTLEPGYGYWVMATDNTKLIVGGSLIEPGPGVPPSRPLQKGWNLIGHYGTADKEVYCSLFSLVDPNEGFPRWSALFGFTGGEYGHFEELNLRDYTEAGKGYWLEMDVEDTYSPATACWYFD